MSAPLSLRPLGEVLLGKSIITEDQLHIALTEQKKNGLPLGKVLVSLGFVTEATVRDTLSESLGQISIDLSNTLIDPSAIALIPKETARRYHVLPVALDRDNHKLALAISDPTNVVALDQIRALLRDQYSITPLLARESDITTGI